MPHLLEARWLVRSRSRRFAFSTHLVKRFVVRNLLAEVTRYKAQKLGGVAFSAPARACVVIRFFPCMAGGRTVHLQVNDGTVKAFRQSLANVRGRKKE